MGGKRYWDPAKSLVEKVPNQLVVSCEQPGIMAAPHWHAQAEVNYVFRGGLEYDMQGRTLRLGAGSVALFWQGVPPDAMLAVLAKTGLTATYRNRTRGWCVVGLER